MNKLFTQTVKKWQPKSEINVGELKNILKDLPDRLDIRVNCITGSELIENIKLECAKETADINDRGYTYLSINPQDADLSFQIFDSELGDLACIANAFSAYREKLKDGLNAVLTAEWFIYEVSKVLDKPECEFCGESDPEKCPHFGEFFGIECECGHLLDDHFNAGERNICGGESVSKENGCQCDGFKEK